PRSQHLRVTALLLQRRSPLRAFEHGLRLHHVNREAGDEVDEAEHGEQEQGRRRRPRHEHELAGHGDEQDEREQMVDEALAAGPHRFEDLDIEQEYADRDDKIADGDREAVVEDQRQGRLGGERKLEYRAFLLIAERHVEEKNDDVEERKRDEQEGESDQVHDGWPSSRGHCKNAKRGVRRDARSLEHVGANWNWAERRRQASFFDWRPGRPWYIPVLRSMWWGRRSSPESLSSTWVGGASASAERRIPRRDGDVLRFGTAMLFSPGLSGMFGANLARPPRSEAALIEDRARQSQGRERIARPALGRVLLNTLAAAQPRSLSKKFQFSTAHRIVRSGSSAWLPSRLS